MITCSLQMDIVFYSPDLLSETQCHLVSSVLRFVLVALEVPEDLVHPNVQECRLLQAIQAKRACISILKVISKNIIMITYSLFHLWVLGNSNPYYPAKSITHQPLEVTNDQKEKQNSPPPPPRERKYLRSWQPWWTRRSLLKKETNKKVISKHFTCPLVGKKTQTPKSEVATLTPAHYTHVDKAPCLPLRALPHSIQLHKYERN